MAEYYPQPAAGQRATAAFMRSMLPLTARKTADTSRAATTTATADPHLQFEVEANAVYTWRGWIKYFADPAADLFVDFSVPAGTLGEWHMAAPGSGTAASGTTGYSLRMESNDVAQSRNAYGTSDADMGAILHGTLRVGATAGTFSLDWAQAASSAIAAVLYTDSWLELRRIQ